MLFKWVVLLVIAWYVSKAFGNLILALRGQTVPPPRPVKSRADEEEIRVTRKREGAPLPNERREVEDARFEDL